MCLSVSTEKKEVSTVHSNSRGVVFVAEGTTSHDPFTGFMAVMYGKSYTSLKNMVVRCRALIPGDGSCETTSHNCTLMHQRKYKVEVIVAVSDNLDSFLKKEWD